MTDDTASDAANDPTTDPAKDATMGLFDEPSADQPTESPVGPPAESPVDSPADPPVDPSVDPLVDAPVEPPPARASSSGRRRSRATAGAVATPDERSLEVRLARVHLRGGMLAMARAELEALVSEGGLDTSALADLAEARWRSGDLAGAGAAAAAHLDEGGREPIALLVAAEALGARGRAAEARAHAKRLLAVVAAGTAASLDELFAGQPRGGVWPTTEVDNGDTGVIETELLAEQTTPEHPASARGVEGDEVAAVEAAIAAGDLREVPVRLGLILRDEGALAPLVLSLADRALGGEPPFRVTAGLQLVRADAFRSMGREIEAAAAIQASRRALKRATAGKGDA